MLAQRAGFAEARLALTHTERRLSERVTTVDRKVETVIDALADFRREYDQHGHG